MTLRSEGVGYRFPTADQPAVDGFDLVVDPGTFVLLTGPTGCGKSTWMRLAAGLLQRHGSGTVDGRIELDGVPVDGLLPSHRVARLGFVAQVPHDQIVTGTVGDEVAFGLESAGQSAEEIEVGVRRALQSVQLDVSVDHPSTALSGGQMARLVVASAIAGSPSILLLDEPLAQLDPPAAAALLDVLRAIADAGTAVVMIEHRVHLVRDVVDRVVVMNHGRIIGEGADKLTEVGLGLALPVLPSPESYGPVLLEGTGLRYRYPNNEMDALAGVDFSLRAGERVALMGPNGSGKSTLLKSLSLAIEAGSIRQAGGVIDVPQDPDLALFCATVRDELAYGPREHRMPPDKIVARTATVAEALNLTHLLDRAPQSLSRGQRLRVAVGAAMTVAPDVLLLDEPTSGQDRVEVARMMRALAETDHTRAIVFATHDEELARAAATRIVRIDRGQEVKA